MTFTVEEKVSHPESGSSSADEYKTTLSFNVKVTKDDATGELQATVEQDGKIIGTYDLDLDAAKADTGYQVVLNDLKLVNDKEKPVKVHIGLFGQAPSKNTLQVDKGETIGSGYKDKNNKGNGPSGDKGNNKEDGKVHIHTSGADNMKEILNALGAGKNDNIQVSTVRGDFTAKVSGETFDLTKNSSEGTKRIWNRDRWF